MFKPVRNIFRSLLNKAGLAAPIQLKIQSALTDYGWFKSYQLKESVDKQGQPVPWCTYSFIKFIEPKLKKDLNLFEYGSGNSTIWYANRVQSIKSVEHDEEWIKKISDKMPSNALVVYKSLDDGNNYSQEIKSSNNKYDIIIIDGRYRNSCVENSIQMLKKNGVIIFDNSEVKDYKSAMDILSNAGFKRIDFWGMLPVVAHESCTSIFYKEKNCLGI